MGGVTPRYGFRFPYQGEVVTPTHFKNLADDIDAALTTVNTKRALALKRPGARVDGPSTPTSLSPASSTVLNIGGTGSFVFWNNDAMFTPGVNDRLTVKTAGIYLLIGRTTGSLTTATTINSYELQLNIVGTNGKTVNHKQNPENMTSPGEWMVTAVWPMQVNDYVQLRAYFSGTGTLQPFTHLEARCLALL